MFHTRRKANRYSNFGFLLLLASSSLFYFSYKTRNYILFFVGCGVLAGTFPLFQQYKIWRSGAKGEEKVAKCLKHLGGRYHVFHYVMLSGKMGDIDHAVVGSNGVFVIETKNNNGAISCSGDSWSQWKTGKKGGSYRGKLGSPSKQAKRNASLLGSLVRRRLHTRLYVNPLVVFANEKAALNIKQPTVPVLTPNELCDHIDNHHSKTLGGNEQDQLAELIQQYSRYNQHTLLFRTTCYSKTVNFKSKNWL